MARRYKAVRDSKHIPQYLFITLYSRCVIFEVKVFLAFLKFGHDLHFFPLQLVKLFGKPIITTSINRHGNEPINDVTQIEIDFPNVDIFEDGLVENISEIIKKINAT